MKSVESFGLPSLNYNPDPSRRRGEYITFIEKLKLVLSTVKQTKKVLSSVSDVKEPKTQSANVALFRVICAQVDGYLRHQLQEIQVSTGKEDGCAALLLLRDLFADASDMDDQIYALNNFKTVTLKTNEYIFDFNKRFGLLYQNVVSSGVFLPEKDRIRYYLRALRQHKDAQILFEVKALTRDFQSGSERSLREIQRLLIKEKDIVTGNQYTMPMEATPKETAKFFKYNRHWKGSKKLRSKNYAAASGSRKKYSTPFQGVCYGCNKTGHTLYECPLTSQEDKRKIYELKRSARSSEKIKQPKSTVMQAHNSETKPHAKKTNEKKGPSSCLKKSSVKMASKNVTFKDAAKSKSYASVARDGHDMPQ